MQGIVEFLIPDLCSTSKPPQHPIHPEQPSLPCNARTNGTACVGTVIAAQIRVLAATTSVEYLPQHAGLPLSNLPKMS